MKKITIKLIRWYQTNISSQTAPRCRHTPSCSNYAIEAYETRNFFYATLLVIKRLLTCNPLFKPKYDPVPVKKSSKKDTKKSL